MAQQRLRVRRLTDEEGRQLQRIVPRGGGKSDKSVVRWRRSIVVLASAGGNSVEAVARLVQTSPDRVREMIHRFNEMGWPAWAASGPVALPVGSRLTTRPSSSRRPRPGPRRSGCPSPAGASASWPPTWPTTRPAGAHRPRAAASRVGEERRHLPADQDVEGDERPQRDEKLDRIEAVLDRFADRVFAFDEFGPLGLHPSGGNCWSEKGRRQRLRANFQRRPASASSTAATRSQTTCSSAPSGRTRGQPTPWLLSNRSGRSDPTTRRSM